MKTVYRTLIQGKIAYEGDDKERAIRTWDSLTLDGGAYGGIEVQSFDDQGLMIRDGWILHVTSNGHVYLNPRP